MHVAHAVNGEDVLLFRDAAEHVVELLGRVLEIIEIGVLRRLHQGEENALVLFRREFSLDVMYISAVPAMTPHSTSRVTGR